MVRLFLSWFVAAGSLAAAPCLRAEPDCQEKVPLGNEGKFSIVYRTFPLTQANPAIRRALVVIHGAGRNADSYFASAVAAGFLANLLDTTLVVAPRFASSQGSCRDRLDPGEISWTCTGVNDWRGGGPAANAAAVNAFDLLDHLLRTFARRDLFPNLQVIVVTGHSAGGQFTHRYAAIGRAEKTIPVSVRYVVSNPSSYLYLDSQRLRPGATCSEKGGCNGEFGEYPEGRNCTTYNLWKYGVEQRTGYAANVPEAEIKSQLAGRDVTYLLGEFDTVPAYGFDDSCPAMAQGPNRLARGITYWNYINTRHGGRHKLLIVPACGHNGRCMYTADAALPLLFPK